MEAVASRRASMSQGVSPDAPVSPILLTSMKAVQNPTTASPSTYPRTTPPQACLA